MQKNVHFQNAHSEKLHIYSNHLRLYFWANFELPSEPTAHSFEYLNYAKFLPFESRFDFLRKSFEITSSE